MPSRPLPPAERSGPTCGASRLTDGSSEPRLGLKCGHMATGARTGLTAALLSAAFLVVRVCTSAAPLPQGQSPGNPRTGLIVGRVVDANGNAAIVNAIVSLTGAGIST